MAGIYQFVVLLSIDFLYAVPGHGQLYMYTEHVLGPALYTHPQCTVVYAPCSTSTRSLQSIDRCQRIYIRVEVVVVVVVFPPCHFITMFFFVILQLFSFYFAYLLSLYLLTYLSSSAVIN